MQKSGTTVLALKYRGGVLVAGDRRTTDLHYHEDNTDKVKYIGNATLIACAGTVATINDVIEELVEMRGHWEALICRPIYVDGQAEILRRLVGQRANYWNYLLELMAVPILAGFDIEEGVGKIFMYDGAGAKTERKNYAVMGSGSPRAIPILDDRWSPNMTPGDAEQLAIRALVRASSDNFTAPPALAPPTVFTASSAGIKQLPEKDALSIAWNIVYEDLSRREENAIPNLEFASGKEKRDE